MGDKPLKGYKRVGKRFIPPMKQIPKMVETSYVDVLLPELIWLGLINDEVGYVPGARLFEKIVQAAHDVGDKAKSPNYALLSTYSQFSDDQKKEFLARLRREAILERLRLYLAPLLVLHEKFPLRFIGPAAESFSREQLVRKIQDTTGRHINKYETPGIVLHGCMLLARLVTGTIALPPELPDFNAVVTNPDSDEARTAAGFLRASALSELAMLKPDPEWCRFFWDRGAEISDCQFEDSESDETRDLAD